MPDVTATVTDRSGNTASAVVSYTVGSAPAGQLAPGVRATPGTVGYLGAESALTVINPGDPLTGPLAGGSWDGNTLILGGSDRLLEGYRVNAWIALTGSNPTMRNCKVVVGLGMWHGVYHVGSGTFTIEDTTVVRSPAAQPEDIPIHLIASDGSLVAKRCDVSGGGDLVHFVGPGSHLSQLVLHSQAFVDESQHADGAQVFKSITPNTPGSYTLELSDLDASGAEGTNLEANSCITQGPAPSQTDGTNLMTATINNNRFNGGLHQLRIDGDMINCVVTNNDFGPDTSFGPVFVRNPASIATWSNNRDYQGNLIPQP